MMKIDKMIHISEEILYQGITEASNSTGIRWENNNQVLLLAKTREKQGTAGQGSLDNFSFIDSPRGVTYRVIEDWLEKNL